MKDINRPHFFSEQQLRTGQRLTPTQIANFLEDFRLLHQNPGKSKLISIKIPENLLNAFKRKCELEDLRYQTKIKELMQSWLLG